MGLQDDMKTLLAMDAQAQKETFTPSHPFTPDVVAWSETKIRNYARWLLACRQRPQGSVTADGFVYAALFVIVTVWPPEGNVKST